jgi:hypothetical protein
VTPTTCASFACLAHQFSLLLRPRGRRNLQQLAGFFGLDDPRGFLKLALEPLIVAL